MLKNKKLPYISICLILITSILIVSNINHPPKPGISSLYFNSLYTPILNFYNKDLDRNLIEEIYVNHGNTSFFMANVVYSQYETETSENMIYFNVSPLVMTSYQESYFGLLVGEALGFSIAPETFVNTFNQHIPRNITDAIYYYLIYSKLGLEINTPARGILSGIYRRELRDIDNLSKRDVYHLLKFGILMDFHQEGHGDLILDRATRANSNFTEEDFFYTILIKETLGLEIDLQWMLEHVRAFYFGQGIFTIYNEVEAPNLGSTFRMTLLINAYDLEFDINYENLINTLRQYRGPRGGYFSHHPRIFQEISIYENYGINFGIRHWYYGLYLYNMIGN